MECGGCQVVGGEEALACTYLPCPRWVEEFERRPTRAQRIVPPLLLRSRAVVPAAAAGPSAVATVAVGLVSVGLGVVQAEHHRQQEGLEAAAPSV
eukprot:CAMPEP_0119469586 /NCGR_PEP_ID=MMETSP1344-20130328/2845_1 /TAXON_ID=236787 /ORGANISM="Florenciella parvula, Strain CCMP2471" /LENGTH=94 /DNA_ID=CAMNT_0007502157 /DNA_START=717 /DNA_END=999 /DNA_ORIENTATION=-